MIGLVGFRLRRRRHRGQPLKRPSRCHRGAAAGRASAVEPNQDDAPPEDAGFRPPRIVCVTRESPAIRFPMPTMGGNLVVPEALSVARRLPRRSRRPRRRRAARPAQANPLANTGEVATVQSNPVPQTGGRVGQQGTCRALADRGRMRA